METTKMSADVAAEIVAVSETEETEIVAKRNIKNSVFTDLFSFPRYQMEAYRTLHPEDTEARPEDIRVVTLKSVMTNHLYNDLGFTLGNRTVFLIEAQSSWSSNIAFRQMMYLSDTYKEHVITTKQDIYGTGPVSLPEPELYVLYSGGGEIPLELSMSQVHWGKENFFLEVKVKVFQGGGEDILSQYLAFGEIYQKHREVLGRTRAAVMETIRECREKGILADYLTEREAEVMDIMTLLYDQETVTELYVENQKEIAKAEEFDRVVEKLMKVQNLSREEAKKLLT